METDMNAKKRLQALEAALKERGVVDVKFFFANTDESLSTIADDAADVLQDVLDNRVREHPSCLGYIAA